MTIGFRAALIAALVTLPALAVAQSPAQPAADQTQPPSAAPPSAGTPAEQAHVTGFRSAKWGMTEPEVKTAIHSDFNIPADKLKDDENLAERTQFLTITVPDLLEGAGTARVSYVFGYKSKKLIQVNVLWGTAADPQVTPDKITAAAEQLRVLFLDSGFDPQTVISNAKLADGVLLVFQGQDADKHMTMLRLAAANTAPPAKNGKPEKPVEVTALSLSYILDPREPDIYRVKKGLF